MQEVVLYGAGSPLIVDYEESLFRARLKIAAVVKNFDGAAFNTEPSDILRPSELEAAQTGLPFLVPLFGPANRQAAVHEARSFGFTNGFSLIDPTAIVPRRIRHDEGLFINAGATIGANCSFGEFTLINRSVSIGHDCVCEAYVSFGPGAVLAGNIAVGRGAVVGAGAIVLPERKIGANSIVAAGSVVTRDVPENCLVAGNPAKIMKDSIRGYGGGAVV